MSYENTDCPCGGQKQRETMLCPECVSATAGTADAECLANPAMSWEHRRTAAMRLLAVSRRRRTARVLLQAAASERFRQAHSFR